MSSESQIIRSIRRRLPQGAAARKWISVGVGDDAATLNCSGWGNHEMALSTDWSLESIHFDPRIHAAAVIGYRALARATSDLAAMGAKPRFFLLSLALPESRSGSWLNHFASGLAQAAGEFRMELIGGDTSANSTVAVNITVGGSVRRGHALTRSGARVGHQIFVSGTLGAAQLGLELLRRGAKASAKLGKIERYALQRHLRPKIRIELGQWLAGESPRRPKLASAAIDTSDGLSTDLAHICEMSNVAARIYATELPVTKVGPAIHRPRRAAESARQNEAPERALHAGEDYELLFTVSPRLAKSIPSNFRGIPITRIGEIVKLPRSAKCRVELVAESGIGSPLLPRGWDSFR